MPRTKRREADFSTRAARARLKPKTKSLPYWRFISEGRFLGYRPHRSATNAGTWCARFYLGGGRYTYTGLGTADDRGPADGEQALSFQQAIDAAMKWWAAEECKAKGLAPEDAEPYTLARCVRDYLDWYAAHRKSAETTRYVVEAHILPALGDKEAAMLTTAAVRGWHQGLAAQPARVRSAKGKPPGKRSTERPEHERKRKATANRVLAILKAALNLAYREGRIASDQAWRRVKPFRGVDAPRVGFLDQEEGRRLLDACKPDFRSLVLAALLTGCRYGELTRLRIADFTEDLAAIYIREAKSHKARHVYLNADGLALFESLTAGRPKADRIFLRADGDPWSKAHQIRRMNEASEVAGITPAVSFHILRHTYASLYLMNGGDLPALARQLGHADTRMTVRHYGHLAEGWRAEEARRHAPTFGHVPVRVAPVRAASHFDS